MILHYFYEKENKDKEIAKKIYLSNVNFIQSILYKKELKIKNEFNSTFELMTILLFIVFFAYKDKSSNKKISQYLMNLYIADIDKSFRDMGIGDMSIGKYVKSHVKKIYYRISKLEIIVKKNNFIEFRKYIESINIQDDLNRITILSNFLFVIISNSLKKAKIEDISDFIIEDFNN